MNLTQAEIDQIINDHFMYEATDNVDAVVGSLADEVEHHVVPSPVGILHDKAHIRSFYEMLFASIRGEGVTPVRRLYGSNFVVDEVIWNGYVVDGKPFLCEGKSGSVSFRLLHVFEFREGKISRENVWCDLAAIQQQLGCVIS